MNVEDGVVNIVKEAHLIDGAVEVADGGDGRC